MDLDNDLYYILKQEDVNTEFKGVLTPNITKEVIAFANTFGGIIYIGVSDNGEVLGIDDIDGELLKLTNIIRDTIDPDITIFTKIDILNKNNCNVIKVSISQGTNKPYYIKSKGLKSSGVYIRQGSSSVPASSEAIRNMIKLSDKYSYEDEISLEQELSFLEFKNEVIKYNDSFKLNDMDKTNLNMMVSERYTNLAFLLSDSCKHSIKIAIFNSIDEESTIQDRFETSGSLLKQLQDAFSFIIKHNKLYSETKGLIRVEKYDYPEVAIREILINTLVHSDYSFNNGNTFIKIFLDRIEFLSYGSLSDNLTISMIKEGYSSQKNPNLANIFYRLKLIEAYGTGLKKVLKSYKEYNLEPEFKVIDKLFKVTLPNINYHNS